MSCYRYILRNSFIFMVLSLAFIWLMPDLPIQHFLISLLWKPAWNSRKSVKMGGENAVLIVKDDACWRNLLFPFALETLRSRHSGSFEVPWYLPVILLLLCVIALREQIPDGKEIVTKENRTEQMWNVTITGKKVDSEVFNFKKYRRGKDIWKVQSWPPDFRSCWFLLYVL